MSAGLHISISAETIFSIGGLNISNSILTSLIVSALLIALAFALKSSLKGPGDRPSPLQNFIEMLVEGIYGLVHSVTNETKKTRAFMPLILTFFMFIIANNWFGLLPGVGTIGKYETESEKLEPIQVDQVQAAEVVADEHSETAELSPKTEIDLASSEPAAENQVDSEKPSEKDEASHSPAPKFVPFLRAGTADLNTTLALALVTMIMTQVWGVHYLHLSYFKKFFDFSDPIHFFVGILELVSDFSKILSFAFRLFGNVFAGEVLLAVIGSLVPLVVPMAFYGLEIFVGAIQGLVFALLSLIFYHMATLGHEEH